MKFLSRFFPKDTKSIPSMIGGGSSSSSSSSSNSSMVESLGLEEPEIQLQLYAMGAFILAIALIRFASRKYLSGGSGSRVLDLSALNDASMCKEVFLAYLNAALLEPVLAIGGMEEVIGQELAINILTLGSICWWIWMVTDAFDYTDICQSFKYHVDLREEASNEPKKYSWLRMRPKEEDAALERRTLKGSVRRDIALWLSLASIGAAWLPGPVSHRDVMHAYAIVLLWLVLHHSCRRATCWGNSYLSTMIFPSAALMPMEYCMPLMDTFDCVEDLDFVESYRDYVMERTGVELTLLS